MITNGITVSKNGEYLFTVDTSDGYNDIQRSRVLKELISKFTKDEGYKVEAFANCFKIQYDTERLLNIQLNNEPVCCRDCKYFVYSNFFNCYGECLKGYKGIVKPYDTCEHGIREE